MESEVGSKETILRLSVKVGDLVRPPRCPTLGIGIVTAVAEGTGALKVFWPTNPAPTAEIKDALEIVSENK